MMQEGIDIDISPFPLRPTQLNAGASVRLAGVYEARGDLFLVN